jgi:glutaredoxin
MSNPIRLAIYSRPNCHLCDEAKDVIDRVRRRVEFEINLVDIESDPTLEAAYGAEIPVIFLNGNKVFKYRVDEAELERKIRRLWKM